jgi:hypothetical protein
LSTWAEALLASGLDCEFVDLKGLAASRKAVSQAIPTAAASVFFCHGKPEALLGHHESILDAGNANLAADRIVVAIACSSARTLGMTAVLEGAVGFIGFSQILVWCPDFGKEFGEAAISGVREMAKGTTLGGAAETIRKCFAQLAKTFSESFDRSGAENAILGMIAAH